MHHKNFTQEFRATFGCRLIPLVKNLGLRPVSVSEILSHVTRKVIVSALLEDVISLVESLQVCAGYGPECEAEERARYSIFEEENSKPVPLIDASMVPIQ